MYPYVHSSIICNSQVMETTRMSINKGMEENMCYTDIYTMKYYSAIKKNKIVPWMDLLINHTKQGHKDKDKYHRLASICGI